ncbi:MAG: extracellular solute-binding protein [Lachnospiraceae bacterium]|nr:extracellular solute-binding protein [Lachnospiraceae bacterium]
MPCRKQKSLLFIILTILLAVTMVGCGRKAADGIDPNEIAFLAEYRDFDLGEAYIQAAVYDDDYLFIYTNEWNQEDMISINKITKVSLLTGESENLVISDLRDNLFINGMALNAQGKFILMAGEWSEDGYKYFLTEVSDEGNLINEKDITEVLGLGSDEWFQTMYSNSLGELYFVLYGSNGNYRLVATDTDFNLRGKIEHNNYIESVITAGNGDTYITSWGNNGLALKKVDFENASFGPDLSISGTGYGNARFARGGSTGLLLSDSYGIHEVDIEKLAAEKLLNYIDCDLNIDDARYFGQLSNGDYWILNQSWGRSSSNTELVLLTQTTYGELPPREYLTYATLYMNSDLRAAIIKFNKSNREYRIRIKEYITSYDEGAYEAGLIQFNNDLASGRGSDILDLSSVNFRQLAAKGALQDINPHINKSADIDRSEFFERALNAFEIDGKLYGVMPSFTLNTYVGHASKLEGIDRWTMAEMMEWANRYPDASLLETTSSSIMYMLIFSLMDSFVDWNSGKCNFDSDEFIRIMEFASQFGNEYPDWNDPDRIGTHEGFAEGHFLLSDQYVYDISYMQMVNAMFDGEPKYIGYPSESGSGIKFNPNGAVGINAKSKHKDGAYKFVEFLLSDAYQIGDSDSYRYTLPIKRAAFDQMVIEASTPNAYMIGPDGEEQASYWGYGDLQVEIYVSRNADYADTLRDLVERAEGIRAYDEQINKIISDEVESFFSGQKSAKEVAGVIQNRVQVYVNENR